MNLDVNKGINKLALDNPSQVEFNRRKNVEQDQQIATISATLANLVTQSPGGYLPRVYYGLTRTNQTYRFTANATATKTVTGSIGTAFELYSPQEPDNAYIPAIAIKDTETTIKIIIQGDYNYDTDEFTAINMITGASATITFDESPLSRQDASYLGDYAAADNPGKPGTGQPE